MKNKTKTLNCTICKKNFVVPIQFRRKDACNDCYTPWRKAYNFFYTAKHRSTAKNYEFDLDVEWIFERLNKPCPKTGYNFVVGSGGKNYSTRNPYSPSMDRIDNSKGYTKDNVQVVCWIYNAAKQTFSDKELLDFCKQVVLNDKRCRRNTKLCT